MQLLWSSTVFCLLFLPPASALYCLMLSMTTSGLSLSLAIEMPLLERPSWASSSPFCVKGRGTPNHSTLPWCFSSCLFLQSRVFCGESNSRCLICKIPLRILHWEKSKPSVHVWLGVRGWYFSRSLVFQIDLGVQIALRWRAKVFYKGSSEIIKIYMLTVVRRKLQCVPSIRHEEIISSTSHCHGEHSCIYMRNSTGVIPNQIILGHAWLFVLKRNDLRRDTVFLTMKHSY